MEYLISNYFPSFSKEGCPVRQLVDRDGVVM
jgi:hypothetical protein